MPSASRLRRANSSIGCTGCHLDKYQGTGSVPRLAGQNHDYLVKTLSEFRSGARGNNPGMSSLANATSEPDLAALETYLAGNVNGLPRRQLRFSAPLTLPDPPRSARPYL